MNRRRLVPTAILAFYLSGCTSWRVQTIAPQRVISERRPALAWVTQRGGPGVLLNAPSIRQDSIVGLEKRKLKMVAIALADVTSIQVRQPDGGKTAGLVLGIVGAVGILLYLAYREGVGGPQS